MIRPISFMIATFYLASCGAGDPPAQEQTTPEVQVSAAEEATADQSSPKAVFDINTVPVSTTELGTFPFFSVPENIEVQNGKGITYQYNKLYFAINDSLLPIEGRAWMGNLVAKSGSDWSDAWFEKSYNNAIIAAGGVKIYDGRITRQEYDRVADDMTYSGEAGTMDFLNDKAKTYVIRRPQGNDVYIQFCFNGVYASLQILEKEAFRQTITLLKAEQIRQQLDQTGKAVLHINFHTDKATLEQEGRASIEEIHRLLKSDATLKLDLHGHTDNAGSKEHNQVLSQNRAETVKSELVGLGISKDRLSARGFGQDKPIADNNTPDGMAQNRRVELIKI